MPRAPFDLISDGQQWSPPFASEWNPLMQIAREARSHETSSLDEIKQGEQSSNTVLVNNSSGSDYAPGKIVKITGPSYATSSDSYQTFTFEAGNAVAADRGKWGVVVYGIPDGQFGIVALSGVAYVEINVVHASHDRADVVASGTLESGFSGTAEILHKPAGTGTLDCIVRFPTVDQAEVKGVVTESGQIDFDDSGEVTVHRNGSATTSTITAHLNWMHGDEDVSNGKEVICRWFGDELKWVIVGAECE